MKGCPVRMAARVLRPRASGVDELATALAMSGTEVERIAHVGVPRGDGNRALFRIGQVTAVEQHPDADRLRVCRVAARRDRTCARSCAARPTWRPGRPCWSRCRARCCPTARSSARAKLRGVESDGMILSETEVQLGTDSAGHHGAARLAEAGDEAQRYVPLGDDVLELEVTPNRPDCLAVYGVAREVHAVTAAPLAPDPADEDAEPSGEGDAADLISVSVEDLELCPRFSVRVFTDVKVGPSPLWLKARLMAAGLRPISNVVDITNYVMLLLGQPMHAYDLDRRRRPGAARAHAPARASSS